VSFFPCLVCFFPKGPVLGFPPVESQFLDFENNDNSFWLGTQLPFPPLTLLTCLVFSFSRLGLCTLPLANPTKTHCPDSRVLFPPPVWPILPDLICIFFLEKRTLLVQPFQPFFNILFFQVPRQNIGFGISVLDGFLDLRCHLLTFS